METRFLHLSLFAARFNLLGRWLMISGDPSDMFPRYFQRHFECKSEIRDDVSDKKHLSHSLRSQTCIYYIVIIYTHDICKNYLFLLLFYVWKSLNLFQIIIFLHSPVLHFQSAIAAIKIIPTETLAPTYKNKKSIKYHK